jgi:hypothetical protein
MMDYSVDGGENVQEQLQIWSSLGKIGSYLQRARWFRLGAGIQAVDFAGYDQ